MGHRVTAIGHDPILGLIFGTANIATATLTNNRFQSYHIGTNAGKMDFFNPAEFILKRPCPGFHSLVKIFPAHVLLPPHLLFIPSRYRKILWQEIPA